MATFRLDRFQLEAIAALDAGRSVLVAAPTGSGKTVVADAAIDLALHAGGKAFYTTPIKALSNQKFLDLSARLGRERVGLLTGDATVNGDADVVVMTTEVLRNMIYVDSPALDRLHVVVLDEVHYLQDSYRGPVWEEVIIGLPTRVRLVCLSATVSNVDEVGDWLTEVRGPTSTVLERERPVELRPLYMVSDRTSDRDHLLPILVDGRPNPEAFRFDRDPVLRGSAGRGRPGHRFGVPRRVEVVERLLEEEMLPAIYFIFSRDGCDDAARSLRTAGMRLTDSTERDRIRDRLEHAVESMSRSDFAALDLDRWFDAAEAGIASHHAGMVPALKEAVERCFTDGLIKVVFATETLALGVNMPARSVVIEKVTKFNGDTHDLLTPAQFTQMTGRAGRRGLDEVGHAIVCWSPYVAFEQVAALTASRDFALTSAFRPTYNMAANLVLRSTREQAIAALGQSFAQFQTDRRLVGERRRIVERRAHLATLKAAAACDRGDIADYVAALDHVDAAERRSRRRSGPRPERVQPSRRVASFRPGDVLEFDGGEHAVVVTVSTRRRGRIRLRLLWAGGQTEVVDADAFDVSPRRVDRVDMPTRGTPSSPSWLAEVAASLATYLAGRASDGGAGEGPGDSPGLRRARAAVVTHPVARCPDAQRHVEAHRSFARAAGALERAERDLGSRAGSVVARFEAVLSVLEAQGMLEGWSLTPVGRQLARIYHESDLLVTLALADGLFDGLDGPSIAALTSAFAFEERRVSGARPSAPNRMLAERLAAVDRHWERLVGLEASLGLPTTRRPDPGFMAPTMAWASGQTLDAVLAGEISGGDFVRTTRLVIDLLGQVARVAADDGTRSVASAATRSLRRGVVALDAVERPARGASGAAALPLPDTGADRS